MTGGLKSLTEKALLHLLKQFSHADLFHNQVFQIGDLHPLLRHSVAVANGYRLVLGTLVVNGLPSIR